MDQSILQKHRFSPVAWLAIFAVSISFITRIILLFSFRKDIDAAAASLICSFPLGLLYDIVAGSFIILPFVLQLTFTSNFIYTKRGKWFAIAFFMAFLGILLFTNIIPKDFNKDLHKGLVYYVLLRFIIYLFLLTRSEAFRFKWRANVLKIFFFLVIFLLLFNAVSEWFFWNEFSSRYNFIAVDYLVYTNEVLGNIKESYPVYWLIGIVFLLSGVLFWFVRKPIQSSVTSPLYFGKRLLTGCILFLLPVLSVYFINPQWQYFSKNNYANELAGNGVYDFVLAFKNNELDYYRYYKTIDDRAAFGMVREQLGGNGIRFTSNQPFSIERQISYEAPETRMNVVLISVESLSASFMKSFGNKDGITPYLDSLADKGMLFTNLYASGTRTVRGLEALALSIPPTPGQSLVKRPANEGLFSMGSVLRSKGYTTQFIYGGYGYFDNMNYFFANNGYDVIDRTALSAKEIHYSNIWGVADEDLFTLALRTMDKNAAMGKPFFSQVMTVSNHRPYTYPENRIDIPPSSKSRSGAVKYTDYAIGDFIKRASAKPWFSKTIFVIVADHCASSAGSNALPVTGYHIPMIIYSPAFIQPQKVDALTAQIDIAPTVLGLLHCDYTSKFFGIDVLNTSVEKQRAFISTYQGLGYLAEGKLVVQSPVKQIKTYVPDMINGHNLENPVPDSIIQQAIANYQVAAWLIKHRQYKAIPQLSPLLGKK
ncbi:LTA synthase family protein [Ferruginibacter sp. HRS2-29]|uniref:LTA synthase family protein n=1 Tax=Ferruginibacter sp. HRS2-29 TaxID=2487334 RepID=UPI0020CBEE3C|nr:sulfatase-like hydrolase/transferase [Ferruginibacter sp. HRS2-29]MCP9752470.1 LTA synthase family protein [Ferruginibacter sp. HRS2-29]